jgi:hypothetical protein
MQVAKVTADSKTINYPLNPKSVIKQQDKEQYQDYLDSSENKNLPQNLDVLSDSFTLSDDTTEDEVNDWWIKNVTEFKYVDYWNYLDPFCTEKPLSYSSNVLCKLARINDDIFLEVHDEIIGAPEPTTWLKARVSLRNTNGTPVKHGIQEVWHEIPSLKHHGYHIIDKNGKKVKYKLMRSTQAYRANYSNDRAVSSQSWYASGKQKSNRFNIINGITNEENTISKEWYESGNISSVMYGTRTCIKCSKYDERGKLVKVHSRNI